MPITTPEYKGGLRTGSEQFPNSGVGYALGVDLGYKQMFGEGMFGLRYYVDYYFSQSFGSKATQIVPTLPDVYFSTSCQC